MQALASRGSLRGGRRGAPPGVGGGVSLRVSPLRGLPLKFREFGASAPAPRRRRNESRRGPGAPGGTARGPGPQGSAARHSLLSGRRAAPPRSGRSPQGPRLPALRPPPRPSHAVRGAQAVRAEGRRQASSPRRAARSPSPQSFSCRSSFQKGPTQGARRWRSWRVSAAARARRPCRVATAPGSAIGTRPQLCSATERTRGSGSRHF